MPNDILAQSEMPIFDDQLTLARIRRPNGSVAVCQPSIANELAAATGEPVDMVPAYVAVDEAPSASVGVRFLCCGIQLSRGLRDVLTAKGYVVTVHKPGNLPDAAPWGGVQFQSEIPVFDDMLGL